MTIHHFYMHVRLHQKFPIYKGIGAQKSNKNNCSKSPSYAIKIV